MLKDELQTELRKLQSLKKRVTDSLKHAPQGRMRCEMAKGKYPQYYYLPDGMKWNSTNGRYLRKSEKELIQKLAQKEYDLILLERLVENEKLMNDFLRKYQDNCTRDSLLVLHEGKRRQVIPYETSDQEYLDSWYKLYTGEKNTYPIENGFPTEQGEIVRSKSEKMIADKLFYRNIPYQYEPVLHLDGFRVLYPDFAVLNMRTRKTYYLEHFGMMDNPDYCKKALEKMDVYEQNHIYQNESLLVSMESSLKGINMHHIDLLINRFLV